MNQHANNSVVDLFPMVIDAMKDRQWKCLSELMMDVGEHIMPERATRFYTGQMGSKQDGIEKRPLDERIRQGRRRGIYLCLKAMINRGMVECKNSRENTDNREYKLVRMPDELPKRKGRKKAAPVASNDSDAGSMTALVDSVEKEFTKRFPGSRDHGDFKFHIRHLRRIAMLHELAKAKADPKKTEPKEAPVDSPTPVAAIG